MGLSEQLHTQVALPREKFSGIYWVGFSSIRDALGKRTFAIEIQRVYCLCHSQACSRIMYRMFRKHSWKTWKLWGLLMRKMLYLNHQYFSQNFICVPTLSTDCMEQLLFREADSHPSLGSYSFYFYRNRKFVVCIPFITL